MARLGVGTGSGVLLSALIVAFGAAIYLVRHVHSPTDYRVFRGEPSDLRRIGGIVRDALALRGRGIIQPGLLLLIATPVARVALSIFGFAEESFLRGPALKDHFAGVVTLRQDPDQSVVGNDQQGANTVLVIFSIAS